VNVGGWIFFAIALGLANNGVHSVGPATSAGLAGTPGLALAPTGGDLLLGITVPRCDLVEPFSAQGAAGTGGVGIGEPTNFHLTSTRP
jgi:hypothetical protein